MPGLARNYGIWTRSFFSFLRSLCVILRSLGGFGFVGLVFHGGHLAVLKLCNNHLVSEVVEEYPFTILFTVDETANLFGFASRIEAFVGAVVHAIAPMAAYFDLAVGEEASLFAVLFVVEVEDDVAGTIVVVVGFPLAVFEAVAEVASVVDFSRLIVGCPDAILFALDIGAFVKFLTFFVPGGPGALFVAVDVFAFSPFLARFIVVGPGAGLDAVGVVAFDAEFARGAPIVEPFALFLAMLEFTLHVELAFLGPPSGKAFEFVVLVGAFKFEFAIFVPFLGGAFAAARDEVDFVFLLAVGEPRLVGAVFLSAYDFHFALEVAVLEPCAGETIVGVAFLGAAGTVFIEDFPESNFLALAVVAALLVDFSVGVPPGPVADADAIVVHHALDGHLRVAVVVFLIFDLGLDLGAEQGCGQEENGLFH